MRRLSNVLDLPMREVDTEVVKQKAIEIVKIGEGMRTEEFFGALAIAAGQMLKTMSQPDMLRPTVEWYINEVARMAMTQDEERTH